LHVYHYYYLLLAKKIGYTVALIRRVNRASTRPITARLFATPAF
jgi:hypothetical protein